MPRVVKRSASQANVKAGPSRRSRCQLPASHASREAAPQARNGCTRSSLDGYRIAARIDNGRVQLLTRTNLDWTAKYPSAVAALANVNVKTAYIDGELCGVDDAGLPSFAQTQAATDGERGVHLVYYAFDLLHIDGWDISGLSLVERKTLLEAADHQTSLGLQFNGHDTGATASLS